MVLQFSSCGTLLLQPTILCPITYHIRSFRINEWVTCKWFPVISDGLKTPIPDILPPPEFPSPPVYLSPLWTSLKQTPGSLRGQRAIWADNILKAAWLWSDTYQKLHSSKIAKCNILFKKIRRTWCRIWERGSATLPWKNMNRVYSN